MHTPTGCLSSSKLPSSLAVIKWDPAEFHFVTVGMIVHEPSRGDANRRRVFNVMCNVCFVFNRIWSW